MNISISVVILTYNERLHIERCIKSALRISDKVYVVDSHSNDGTQEMARSLGAIVVEHDYVNQAQQMQWAIDNLKIVTDWIIRLDADEYLTEI